MLPRYSGPCEFFSSASSLNISTTAPHVPHTSPNNDHAASVPVIDWTVNRFPPAFIPGQMLPLISTTTFPFRHFMISGLLSFIFVVHI